MATSKATQKGTEPALPGSGFPNEINRETQSISADEVGDLNALLGGQNGPGDAQAPALPPSPRQTPPHAPAGLVGYESRETVAQITLLLQHAEVQGRAHPASGWLASAEACAGVPTRTLHPSVAAYKAEVVEYLRARHEAAVGLEEQTAAEAVAASQSTNP